MKVSTRFTMAFCVCALAVSGCTQPKQTTAIGSATGGAVGAGLGAIIGNQTGNAGAGVAIGAVAGAATGSLIGNALQAQQETAQAQDEALERQDRLIRAQRQELDELRTIKSDPPALGPSHTSYHTTPRQQQTLSPEAARKLAALERRGPSPRAQHVAAVSSVPHVRRNTEPLARYNPSAAQGTKRPSTSRTSAPPKEIAIAEIQESETIEATAQDGSEEKTTISETDLVAVESAPVAEPATLADESINTGACAEAVGEQQSAQAAPENSGKLYHLRRALRLCPNNAAYHEELGRVYLAMGRTSDAQFEFNEALKISPNMKSAQEGLTESKASRPDKF